MNVDEQELQHIGTDPARIVIDDIKVLIKHDMDRVKHLDYMLENIKLLTFTGIQNFVVLLHCSGGSNNEKQQAFVEKLEKEINHIQVPVNLEVRKSWTKEGLIASYGEINWKIIEFDSDVLLSQYFIREIFVILSAGRDGHCPVFHYKYNYKQVEYGSKQHEVKNFVESKSDFLFGQTQMDLKINLDWDERYYTTHEIYGKMDGCLPHAPPSPLLHNWGAHEKIISVKNSPPPVQINNAKFAFYKFEHIPPVVFFGDDLGLERTYSMERQDEFVYHVLGKHLESPGFFLDIACATPKNASNTYVLEKYFNWDGIGVDIGNIEVEHGWSKHRKSKFFQLDATSDTLTVVLKEFVGDKIVDYVSLDVDSNDQNFSAQVLSKILDAGIKFKVMTLEHESFRTGETITGPTRMRLKELGYDLLFEDVSFRDNRPWEDWWVRSELLPYENIMDISTKGVTYDECIEKIKDFTKKEQ
jgi:hypothetical protein